MAGAEDVGDQQMNYKAVNLGLFGLVLLLALVAYFEPGINLPVKKIPLTDLKAEEINFIRITDNHGRELVMERQQGRWMMTAPYKKPANEQRIKQLLGITTTRSFSRFTIPETRLAEFGLDPAPIHLQLNRTRLAFGGNEPIQFRRYVRIGDQLHLISNGFHHHLMAQADDFVSKVTID